MRELVHDGAVLRTRSLHDVQRELDATGEARCHRDGVRVPREGAESRLVLRQCVLDEGEVMVRILTDASIDADRDVHTGNVLFGDVEVSDAEGHITYGRRPPMVVT